MMLLLENLLFSGLAPGPVAVLVPLLLVPLLLVRGGSPCPA